MDSTDNTIGPDIKNRLRSYLPVLFEFLDIKDFDTEQWDKLNSNMDLRHNKRLEDYLANDNSLQVKANIFDIISDNLSGNEGGVLFFNFIKKTLEELSDRLSTIEKIVINKTLYDFLISFDDRFKNYLGELLVLNSMVKSGHFKLVAVESVIAQKQTADFLFEKNDGSGRILVEVVNIHINDYHTKLDFYITDKLKKKMAKKTAGEKD